MLKTEYCSLGAKKKANAGTIIRYSRCLAPLQEFQDARVDCDRCATQCSNNAIVGLPVGWSGLEHRLRGRVVFKRNCASHFTVPLPRCKNRHR